MSYVLDTFLTAVVKQLQKQLKEGRGWGSEPKGTTIKSGKAWTQESVLAGHIASQSGIERRILVLSLHAPFLSSRGLHSKNDAANI